MWKAGFPGRGCTQGMRGNVSWRPPDWNVEFIQMRSLRLSFIEPDKEPGVPAERHRSLRNQGRRGSASLLRKP